MSDHTIAIIRWVLLASAAFNLLQATVLHGVLHRRIIDPWLALADRAAARGGGGGGVRRVPAALRDERLLRVWPVLMAAVFLGLWWYVGTPAGAATLRGMVR